MAFAKGTESKEPASFPKYVGVAPVFVLGVNPTKEEQEKFFGTELQKDPEYLSTIEVEGKNVENLRISFVVRTDPKVGAEVTSFLTFFLQKRPRIGSNTGKYQVIDKYGETAWAVQGEDFTMENGKFTVLRIPQYKDGPANIDIDYRLAYVGEEELTSFLKNYLCIPQRMSYVNKVWVPNKKVKLEECEARLVEISEYFKGNYNELKGLLKLLPNNKVKVLFGVRTTDKGQFQTILSGKTVRNSVDNYASLDKYVKERKLAGAYKDIEFPIVDFKEYTVEATNFKSNDAQMPTTDELPFDGPDW